MIFSNKSIGCQRKINYTFISYKLNCYIIYYNKFYIIFCHILSYIISYSFHIIILNRMQYNNITYAIYRVFYKKGHPKNLVRLGPPPSKIAIPKNALKYQKDGACLNLNKTRSGMRITVRTEDDDITVVEQSLEMMTVC